MEGWTAAVLAAVGALEEFAFVWDGRDACAAKATAEAYMRARCI